MADENVTLDTPAPDEGQPVDQAIDPASVEATDPPADDSASVTLDPPRVFAGKYTTVEELESSYKASNAENSRMASELASLRRAPAPARTEDKPKFSQEQLETWKESRLREIAQNETRAARFQQDGNFQESQRHEAAAQEAARQIRLIDGELRQLDIKTAMQSTTRQSAETRMTDQASAIVKQYASDLVPGTSLYEKAADFLQSYGMMGMDTASPLIQAQSVAMAAQVLGLSSKAVAQTTRKELTKTINTNLKAATVTGGGKSVKSAGSVNFETMSDKDFATYKKQRGWD